MTKTAIQKRAAKYFCECKALLYKGLCRRCNPDEYTELEEAEKKTKHPKTSKLRKDPNQITKEANAYLRKYNKEIDKQKQQKSKEKPTKPTKNTIFYNKEDPFMMMVDANRKNIRPEPKLLERLKRFHFVNGDELLLRDIGDKTILMEKKYKRLVKTGFLITTFKNCENGGCEKSLPELEIECSGHEYIKLPNWLINDFIKKK